LRVNIVERNSPLFSSQKKASWSGFAPPTPPPHGSTSGVLSCLESGLGLHLLLLPRAAPLFFGSLHSNVLFCSERFSSIIGNKYPRPTFIIYGSIEYKKK